MLTCNRHNHVVILAQTRVSTGYLFKKNNNTRLARINRVLFCRHNTRAEPPPKKTKQIKPYMIDTSTIEQLAKSLSNQLPAGLANIKEELNKNFKGILQQQFTKLDLVSREEFDTQSAVLARTREKLDALEKTIAELNNKID